MKVVGVWSVVVVLLLTTAVAGCDKGGGGSEACAPLESAITDAEAAADETLAGLRSGLRAAVATPPVAGTDTCPVDVSRGLAMHRAVRADGIDAFEPPKVRDVRGRAETARMTVTDCEHLPPDSRQVPLDELQAAVQAMREGHDLVVLEQSRVEPAVISGTATFTPGQLQARLLVWSYAESRVVCVADATATSGDEVGVSRERLDSDSLNQDLDRRVAVSGARSLRAVTP